MVQCASPGRGGELVGVCKCVPDVQKGEVSRKCTARRVFIPCCGLLSGLAIVVLCAAPSSGQPSLFTSAHASAANNINTANQDVNNGHSLQTT